ncbi:amidohydrolase [Ignatzschineria rhizosphaerae]|uniref:Amidohydrolase n=1 Tax=Ignatzschineria rhizosphaerae TaxID=2923279 RepID=A0ABY3X454_9GAMM|nr:amidohydrolase [Ignatzschineria rhizosphaerae]UNM95827.1 amidohydrolase [Ignatzschineria rhizosphaerae]
MSPLETLQSWQEEARNIRQSIHKHPELGFEEQQTQKTVVKLLEDYGVDTIDTSFAKTGVIATIKGTLPGKTIGLRADIDALPIQEENTFSHKSTLVGKMHACGHDGHTTMLLMAAKYLAKHRQFSGKVILFFQPAEEGRGGAETMVVKDKVLERYPVDAIYAMHNWPTLEAGKFAIKAGPIMASSDRIYIRVHGKSGHAAQPHNTQDPLLVATQIYQGIQGLVARTIDPTASLVVAITQMHCGDTTNVIADYADMAGTIRTHDEAVRTDILQKLSQLVPLMAEAFGMSATVRFGEISHPVTVNSKAEAERAIDVAAALVGRENLVLDIKEQMTSEDFAFFLEKVPGCYLFIGNGKSDNHPVGLHNSKYDFNDDIIPLGASFLIETVRSYSK